MSRFALRPNEAIIRSDRVVITRGVFAWRCRPGRTTLLWYLGRQRLLILTSERVVIDLPTSARWLRAAWSLWLLFDYHMTRFNAGTHNETELSDVKNVATFEHPVAAAAVIDGQQAGGAFSYLLVHNGWLGRERTVDELLRHAADLRAAVAARKAVPAGSGDRAG